jgi:hypothetical protein
MSSKTKRLNADMDKVLFSLVSFEFAKFWFIQLLGTNSYLLHDITQLFRDVRPIKMRTFTYY